MKNQKTSARDHDKAEQTVRSAKADEQPSFDTNHLFQGYNTIELNHQGQRYLLRQTRENKLILTK